MKTFSENYKVEAASILRDLSMYKVLAKEQVMRLYPGKERKVEKLLKCLEKQYRVWEIDGYYCTSPPKCLQARMRLPAPLSRWRETAPVMPT